jgi:hypothetical protein
MTAWPWRYVPSAVGLAVFGFYGVLWCVKPDIYAALMGAIDPMPVAKLPFGDLSAILQAEACWRHGVNVYAPSACMGGGVFNYSPFMLWFGRLAPGPNEACAGGVLSGGLFLASLSLLPPPGARAELLVRIVAVCSGGVAFAMERGNIDVVIFASVMLGVTLILANRRIAVLGYAVFAFAAACKFYPVGLLAIGLREPRAYVLAALVILLAAFLVYLRVFAHGSAVAISILPTAWPFYGTFGLRNIPMGMTLIWRDPQFTLEPSAGQFQAALGPVGVARLVSTVSRLMALVIVLAAAKTAPLYAAAWSKLDSPRRLFLLAGALVILLCYLGAQNLYYRAIFLLPALPAIWRMFEQSGGPERYRYMVLALSIVFLLSKLSLFGTVMTGGGGTVFVAAAFWLCREFLWAWVAIQLGACIVCFVGDVTTSHAPRSKSLLRSFSSEKRPLS